MSARPAMLDDEPTPTASDDTRLDAKTASVANGAVQFVLLDTAPAARKASHWTFDAGAVSYVFDDEASSYLVERGNTTSLTAPKMQCALDLENCPQAQIEVVEFVGDAGRDCALVVLLCRADGTVVAQDRMPLGHNGRLILSLQPGVAKASFAIRLAGRGRFGSLALRCDRLAARDGAWHRVSNEIEITAPRVFGRGVAVSALNTAAGGYTLWHPFMQAMIRNSARHLPGDAIAEFIASLVALEEEAPDKVALFKDLIRFLTSQRRDDVAQLLRLEIDKLQPTRTMSREIIRGYYALCQYRAAEAAIDRHGQVYGSQEVTSGPVEKTLRELTAFRQIIAMIKAPLPRAADVPLDTPRVSYVIYNALPYASGGYATRSHGLISGIAKSGAAIEALVRPGFPLDAFEDTKLAGIETTQTIDAIPYRFDVSLTRKGRFFSYMAESASNLTQRSRQSNVNILHAASNYYTGLPAVLAARRRGVPFVYEVRGFWEVTRLSRDPDWIHSALYRRNTALEFACAMLADQVFTLTADMASTLEGWGIPAARIMIAPNSIDAEKFTPMEKDRELLARLGFTPEDVVIGYAGSFIHYEGLDDLTITFASLAHEHPRARLLLIGDDKPGGGDGEQITPKLKAIAQAAGLGDRVVFTGRVPHDEIQRYYSVIDICPFPRKPLPVTELVSPMKPLESMAMGKCVIASSVGGMRDMVIEGTNGLIFTKGDLEHLRDRLTLAISDVELRRRLGAQGRDWVAETRSWSKVAARVVERYHHLLADGARERSLDWASRTTDVVRRLEL